MNRIILIGNGFDLAHNLKTSYKNFIDDLWQKEKTNAFDMAKHRIKCFESDLIKIDNFDLMQSFSGYNADGDEYNDEGYDWFKRIHNFSPCEDIFIKVIPKNNFLVTISNANAFQNWVDIEEEYYKQLLKIIANEHNDKIKLASIIKLNQDFSIINEALEKYLKEIVKEDEQKLNCSILHHIYSYFDMRDFTEKGIERVSEEEYQKFDNLTYSNRVCPTPKPTILDLSEKTLLFLNKYQHLRGLFDKSNFKKLILDETGVSNYFYLLPKQILFLNFNYTGTEKKYYEHDHFKGKTEGYISEMKNIEKNVIHIHGKLMNKKNPIIFGYGDEIDDNYKIIEKRNDNKFLENVKSIKYLETDNYKRLLNFINADMYQIFVMGHSCGISDRTLLNTLFEHDNCVSIKVFYYQYKDEHGEIKDNYSDVVRNISRNFNNKAVMREKVVNKQYSKPLT